MLKYVFRSHAILSSYVNMMIKMCDYIHFLRVAFIFCIKAKNRRKMRKIKENANPAQR